jgi:hypothetical protein
MPIVTSIDKEGRCWLVLQPPYESGKPLYVLEPSHMWLIPEPIHRRRQGPRLLAALVPHAITADALRASCSTTDEAARYEVKQLDDQLTLIAHREVLDLDEQGRRRMVFVHGSSIPVIFAPLLDRAVSPPSWPLSLIPRSFPSSLTAELARVVTTARHGLLSWLYPVDGIALDSDPVWIMDLGMAMRAVFGVDASQPEERVIEALRRYAEHYGMDDPVPPPPEETPLARALRLGIEEQNAGTTVEQADLPPIAQPWSFEEMQDNALTTKDGKVWRVIELLPPLAARMSWCLLVERESKYSPQALITFEAWWAARGNGWRLEQAPLMESEERAVRAAHIPLEGKTAMFYEFTRVGVVQATYKRDGSAWRIAEILQERHFKAPPPAPVKLNIQLGRSLSALINKQAPAAPPAPQPSSSAASAPEPSPAPSTTGQLDLVEAIQQIRSEAQEMAEKHRQQEAQQALEALRLLKKKSLLRGTANQPLAPIAAPPVASPLRAAPAPKHNEDTALLQRLARLNKTPKK